MPGCRKTVLALLGVSVYAAAQDLPPGVLLLSQVKRHVRRGMETLPDYTCLESARRFRWEAGPKGVTRSVDTVRLEVLYTGSREPYAAPGARNFREEDPAAFTAGGLSGTGMFAMFLRAIFVNDHAITRYGGEVELGGRRAARFDYRVPALTAGYTVNLGGARTQAGMKGSFWVDPDTLDLLRLEVHADEMAAGSPVDRVATIVTYARTRIGAADVTLPQTAELYLRQTSGEESQNLLEYTHCRSFRAESSVRFGAEAEAAETKPAAAKSTAVTLAAGLMVAVRLAQEITDKDAVGAPVEGRVAANVTDKRGVVIPEGAAVHGRIRRLERYNDSGGYFIVGLEFSDIEWTGGATRFYAELQEIERINGADRFLRNSESQTRGVANGREIRTVNEQIRVDGVPGVGAFFVRGRELKLPVGFKTVWRTTSLRSATP